MSLFSRSTVSTLRSSACFSTGLLLAFLMWPLVSLAATYINASTPFNWIDASGHTKVGYNTVPVRFNTCGTVPPILDDTISDLITIGFNFVYGATSYSQVKIETNGRLQFNNSTCSAGTQSVGPPQTYTLTYPNGTMDNTMKIFGVDLDPTNLVNLPNYPTAASRTSCNGFAICYVSYASIGTAPNRQFVVTWRNVPEWVNATNTSGSFDLQIILNEDGTFVYQYGSIIHGGTGQSQIGWQLTTSDYSVLTFGAALEPTPNSAILFYKPSVPPIAEYRLDEGAWVAGTAGQVADSSASLRHGTAFGLAQTLAGGKVCRGGGMPGNTSAAAVDAIRTGIRFSDASVNLLGQGTIAFWYKSANAWSGGPAAQLLDATLVNGTWFSLTRTAGGTLYFAATDSTGIVRSVETSAQAFAADTWVHVAVTWNFNALPAANQDSLRIYINAVVSSSSLFTSSGTLATTLDYLYLGDNPSGFTAPKGTVNGVAGVVDELRFYNAELNAGQMVVARDATHPCPALFIDHFDIQHASWTGPTCAPGTVTVRACANASCSALYGSGVVAILSSAGAATIWDAASGGTALVIGNGQSSASKSFFTAAGGASFGATGTVTPASPSTCSRSGVTVVCNWTATNSGLLLTVPNSGVIVGGKPVAVSLQAVEASGPTPGAACVPVKGLAGAGLKAYATPVVPASFAGTSTSAGETVGGPPQAANASAGAYVDLPSALPGANNISGLAFDANASTSLWIKHMDSGQWTLSAKLDKSATALYPALSLPGSASVIVVPAGFGVAAATVTAGAVVQTDCASSPTAACDATAGAAARLASAGDAFGNTVIAALWTSDVDSELSDNPVAPSYAGAVTLAPVLVAPTGGNAGTLGTTNLSLVAGTGAVAAQQWTQSGALRINASGTYLAQNVVGQSAVLARFSPHHLETVLTTHGCGNFTYSAQPITALTIRAMDGATTSALTPNYKGSFARTVTVTDGNGSTSGTFSANVIPAAGFASGSALASPVFSFTSPTSAPLTLKLRAADAEVSSAGYAEASEEIRSGRVQLGNANGSELLNLPLDLRLQYWASAALGWQNNAQDTCTLINASDFAFAFPGAGNTLAACETAITIGGAVPNYTATLTRPGAGNSGWTDITLNLDTLASGNRCTALGPGGPAATTVNSPWLRYNWKGILGNPSARATFGVYKSGPIIHRREMY